MDDKSLIAKAKVTDLTKEAPKKQDIYADEGKIIFSGWHIMINSNRYLSDVETEDFKEGVTHILDNINQFLKFKEEGAKFNRKWIVEANTEAAFERGSHRNQIHVHALVRIRHKTKLQLDYSKINDYLKSEVESLSNGFKLRIYRFSNPDIILQQYLNKTANTGKNKKGAAPEN